MSTAGGGSTTGGSASAGGGSTGGSETTGGAASTGGSSTGGSEATGGAASTGGSSTGGSEATGGAASGGSSTGGSSGTPLVQVLGSGGVPSFYIEATEVTNAQYATFLSSHPTVDSSLASCDSNASYQPSGGWPSSYPDRPVAYVDWCDAHDYCESIGRRLCGAIGGGTLARSSIVDPAQSQWFRACGGPTGRAYPYGSSLNAANCNTNGTNAVDVGSMISCQGDPGGLFDMVGNVFEWVDSCSGSNCVAIGSAYTATSAFTCDAVLDRATTVTTPAIGIRCCTD